VVENVFGILSSVFRVFRKPMLLEPKKAELVVMACVYLHNFLRKEKSSRDIYSPTDLIDHEVEGQLVRGTWREEIQSNSTFTPMERVEEYHHVLQKKIEMNLLNIFRALVLCQCAMAIKISIVLR